MPPREQSANSLFRLTLTTRTIKSLPLPSHSHHENYQVTPSSDSLSSRELSSHSLFRLTLTTRTNKSLPLPPHSRHKDYRLTPSSASTHHENYQLTPSSDSHHDSYQVTPSSPSLSPQELSVLSFFPLPLTKGTIGSLPLPPHSHHKNYWLFPSSPSLSSPELSFLSVVRLAVTVKMQTATFDEMLQQFEHSRWLYSETRKRTL